MAGKILGVSVGMRYMAIGKDNGDDIIMKGA